MLARVRRWWTGRSSGAPKDGLVRSGSPMGRCRRCPVQVTLFVPGTLLVTRVGAGTRQTNHDKTQTYASLATHLSPVWSQYRQPACAAAPERFNVWARPAHVDVHVTPDAKVATWSVTNEEGHHHAYSHGHSCYDDRISQFPADEQVLRNETVVRVEIERLAHDRVVTH